MRFLGLTDKEASEKLANYGFNEIREVSHLSIFKILLRQVQKNFIVYLLVFSMLISFIAGKDITGYTILGVITIVIITGFIQEYKAEKSIKALRQMLVPVSIAIRNGKETQVMSKNLVPGDVIVLRNGEKIPADCIVLEENDLVVNESILTGEAREIKKIPAANEKAAKKESMLFMGTFITNGRCVAKIIHTGMNTEFGKIANLITTAEKELPLQKKVNEIAKYMVTIAIVVSSLVGSIMLTKSTPLTYDIVIDILIVLIALCVSAFPEGFPVVLTTTLASGAYNMAKKNAIVNRLSTIETLGETTVICSDKTGTITKGEMTVKKIYTDDKIFTVTGSGYNGEGEFLLNDKKTSVEKLYSLKQLLKASVLCNDSRIERTGIDGEYNLIGTPTEGAILIMAAKAGIFKDDMSMTRLEEIPFNSHRKTMSVLYKEDMENYIYAKGAPEVLIKKCKYIQRGEKLVTLRKEDREEILAINKKFATQSLRTLALSYKRTKSSNKSSFEEDLVFLGIVAMEDPPRENVRESIETARLAGIKVKMITGDNKETAKAIASEIGLTGNIIEGEDMDKLTDEELSKVVSDIVIFTRVRPEHKIRIVKALKSNGEIVTMTGDGVNDAPALKEAHIGVAMGKNGTDVSREVSDLVLKDDNFSTIITAVAEGRSIFSNIRKFVTYALSCNFAELMVIALGIAIGLPLPLIALQILFMNMVTDDLPAITLGFNPQSRDVMKRGPRKDSRILNRDFIILLAICGIIMGAGTLGVFSYSLMKGEQIEVARTAALLTLIFFELFNAFNFRSFRHTNYEIPVASNKYLLYASLASIVATIFIIYGPLQGPFGVHPVGISYWIIAIIVASSITFIIDILKMVNNKKKILNFD